MTFRAPLERHGKTATGIQVPPDVVEALGSGKRPAVVVTINGYSYRSTVAPMGGVYLLPVSAEIRAAAGIAAGDEIEIDLQLDTAPRVVEVPDDFAAALEADGAARQVFDRLSYSNQRRHVRSIEDGKTPERRLKRIAKAVATLQDGVS